MCVFVYQWMCLWFCVYIWLHLSLCAGQSGTLLMTSVLFSICFLVTLAILKQTNEKGGLKFLLPAFKAHRRNSKVIEVKGERREQQKVGWCGPVSKCWSLALQSIHGNLALTGFDLDKSTVISSPRVLPVPSTCKWWILCFHAGLFAFLSSVVHLALGRGCWILVLQSEDKSSILCGPNFGFWVCDHHRYQNEDVV